jgi:hypothetical protein
MIEPASMRNETPWIGRKCEKMFRIYPYNQATDIAQDAGACRAQAEYRLVSGVSGF